MKSALRSLLTLAPVLLVACAATTPAARSPAGDPDASIAARLKEEDEIREAVFRYQFGKWARSSAAFFCLELIEGGESRDPGPALMARFAGNEPRVLPASACESGAFGVFEKPEQAGAPRGVVFTVGDIRIDGDDAVAEGGYFEGGLSASGNTYTLQRKDGKWVVTKDDMHWIS